MIKKITCLHCVLLLLLSSFGRIALAAEDSKLEWEWDVGLTLNYSRGFVDGITDYDGELGASLFLSGGLYYDRFFIETAPTTQHPITFGYVLKETEFTRINLVAESWFSAIDPDEQTDGSTVLDGIDIRKPSIEIGVEYQRNFSNLQLRTRLLHDALGKHDGLLATVEVARPIFTEHVYLVPSIGLAFVSANAIDYYYGIDEAEATMDRPFYQPGSAWFANVQLYAERPLNDSWSIISFAGLLAATSAVTDSPIVTPRNNAYRLGVGVLWTF